jgi:hypothetical protein
MGESPWNMGAFHHCRLTVSTNASSNFCGSVQFANTGGFSGPPAGESHKVWIGCVGSSQVSFMVLASRGDAKHLEQ